jgi:hypothetical protein
MRNNVDWGPLNLNNLSNDGFDRVTSVVKKSLLGAGLFCVVYLALTRAAPTRSVENIVLSQTGRYVSPQGSQVVEVSWNEDGRLKIDMKNLRCGNGSMTTFQSNPNWFMCFDATDRLRVYLPRIPSTAAVGTQTRREVGFFGREDGREFQMRS